MSDSKVEAKPAEKKAKKAPAALDAISKNKTAKMIWTLEKCMKVSKRFKSAKEWETGAPSSYKSAVAKGWLDQCFPGSAKRKTA